MNEEICIRTGLWEWIMEKTGARSCGRADGQDRQAGPSGTPMKEPEYPGWEHEGEIWFKTLIGKNIREYREKAGMNQEELGKSIFAGKRRVIDLEKGRRDITLQELFRIAAVFHCRLTDLCPQIASEMKPIPKDVSTLIRSLGESLEHYEQEGTENGT